MNPCDVDYKSALSAGGLADAGIGKLWRGEPYEQLRRHHLSGLRQTQSPCKGCVVV
jgi:hypothetical protein